MKFLLKFTMFIAILLLMLFLGYKVFLSKTLPYHRELQKIKEELKNKVSGAVEVGVKMLEEKAVKLPKIIPTDTTKDTTIENSKEGEVTKSPAVDSLPRCHIDYYALALSNYRSIITAGSVPKNEDSIFIQKFATHQVYRRGRITLAPDLVQRFRAFVTHLKGRFPDVKIIVTSGVRSRKENNRLENASVLSYHLTGDALDICVTGTAPKEEIIRICKEYFDIVLDEGSHIHVAIRR